MFVLKYIDFPEVPKDVWPRLVSQKLSQIKVICDFTPGAGQVEMRNIEIKTRALSHLIEYLGMKAEGFHESNYPVLIETFAKNVLRPVPPATNPEGDEYDPEEDEDVLEPSWPHLCLVYDMFVKFLELPDFSAAIARKSIDQSFVVRLMSLFDVEDPRERDLVKTTLHRVYGKFLHLRPVIRKLMRSIFTEVVQEGTKHKIAEMLEILGSVINGFALPIRDEHRTFLEKTLIPLHKSRNLPCFFTQLCFCITQFVEKDPMMSHIIVPGLIRIWPKTNTAKEVLFLSELEEILLRLDTPEFAGIAELVFHRLGMCIASQHFQVAEKSLMLWHNEDVLGLLVSQSQLMIHIVTPFLLHHSTHHWNQNVKALIIGVIQIFLELNPRFFDFVARDFAARCNIEWDETERDIKQHIKQPAIQVDTVMDMSPQESLASEPDIQVQPPTSASMRRKSVLPTNFEVAAALAQYRPSPPPEPLPNDEP